MASPRGVTWWQRAWDLHSRSWVRVRACTSCKSLGQPRFYSLTWAHKVRFPGGGVSSNLKKKLVWPSLYQGLLLCHYYLPQTLIISQISLQMCTFRVQLQLICPQPFKNFLQSQDMTLFFFGFSDHIIYIHLNFFMHHVMEKFHHRSLISCSSIL